MKTRSLEDLLAAVGNPVEMLRNSQVGAYVYPIVPYEYSTWRDEQLAWRETAVLFDQSHHLVNIYIEGRDALKMLSYLATNSFLNFPVKRARQFAPCSYAGFVIGDGILFHVEENRLVFVGRAPAANWIEFHAETGGWDVKVEKDDRSPSGPKGKALRRACYHYQIQGPSAPEILEKLNGASIPGIKFFHMEAIRIAGRRARVLSHGMAGAPGLEIWGPYEERKEIRAAIIDAGRDFGLREVGARAYATNTLESGWIPSPLPAIYSGEKMKPYRQWLPAASCEGTGSLGGSFASEDIADYYMSPYALGYGPLVEFDHDFIGRDALKKMAGRPQRKKVTFAWNAEDVLEVFRSMFEAGETYKCSDLPLSNYASASYDRVQWGAKTVGFSMFAGYSYHERSTLSLGVVDPDIETGAEVRIVWGEAGNPARKTAVERHKQTSIRAVVSAVPHSSVMRETYANGWRRFTCQAAAPFVAARHPPNP